MYNRLFDECEDSDRIFSKNSKVASALKFFHDTPLIIKTNDRIEEELHNGTKCCRVDMNLLKCCHFVKEIEKGAL